MCFVFDFIDREPRDAHPFPFPILIKIEMVNCQFELRMGLAKRRKSLTQTEHLFPWLITFVGIIAKKKIKEKRFSQMDTDVDVNNFRYGFETNH